MNKSLVTNVVAVLIVILGYVYQQPIILSIGMFALSGAITNWLAVYMLFEKVPGLYGSGVIPNRFEEFKSAIKHLMMRQFFTDENIDRFLKSDKQQDFHLAPVIEKVDLSSSFDSLVEVIMQSSFGSMLGMFGGVDALTPLKDPFIKSMKTSLIDMTKQENFQLLLQNELEKPDVLSTIKQQIEEIVDSRLNELTPQIVKEIIQEMIKQHLGWLVVWGGIFGGLIGLMSALVL